MINYDGYCTCINNTCKLQICQQQHLYQQYLYLQNQQQLLLSLIDDDDEFIEYPISWQIQAQCTKIGLGRGKVIRQKRNI